MAATPPDDGSGVRDALAAQPDAVSAIMTALVSLVHALQLLDCPASELHRLVDVVFGSAE
jgi:hypothetical protein